MTADTNAPAGDSPASRSDDQVGGPSPPTQAVTGLHPRHLLLLDTPALRPFTYMGSGYQVRVLGWAALTEAARLAPPSAVALVEAFPDGPDTPDLHIKALMEAAPLTPVLAGFDLASARHAGVRLLAEWGVSEVVDLPIEHTPSSLLVRLNAVHALPFKRRLAHGLAREVSANALTLVLETAGIIADGGLSGDVARSFGVAERTLTTWCAREALPQPRRLLAWLRVLLALSLLEQPWRTVRHTAHAIGYTDEKTLRRAARGLLGTSVELRQTSFSHALSAFSSELASLRQVLRVAPRAGSTWS